MAEALWVQQSGVTYGADEDRRLVSAMSTEGVVSGLVITATGGAGISVSAGTAIISDGAGGAYVAYTTAATSLTMPNGTTNIYIQVNTTTAQVTVTSGSTPSSPYLTLAAITAAGGVVSTPPNSGISLSRALPPNAAGAYLKLTGGTVTGPTTFSSTVAVTGMLTANGGLNAPEGVILGGTYPTARHYHHIGSTVAAGAGGTGINRFASSSDFTGRESIYWSSSSVGVTDYANNPYNPSAEYNFYAGPTGYYALAGYVNTNGPRSGIRRTLATILTGTDISFETWIGSNANDDLMTFSGVIPLNAGQSVRVRCAHNVGETIEVQNGRVMFRLIQAS
jgi:hypothetical protein